MTPPPNAHELLASAIGRISEGSVLLSLAQAALRSTEEQEDTTAHLRVRVWTARDNLEAVRTELLDLIARPEKEE